VTPFGRHLKGFALWWVGLFWLWMLLAGEWNRIEWIAGACAATAGALLAELERSLMGLRFRIPLRTVASAWSVPLTIVVDFLLVLGLLFRSLVRREIVRGRFVAREFDPVGPDPRSFGIRAFRTLAANYSPNAYVVEVDAEQGLVLFHDLVVWRRSEEPA
jgi:hypothetical protein